jgi:transposase-like protein
LSAEVEVGFIVFVAEPSRGEEIAGEVRRMRTLGMSLRAIGRALAVDEKTVRKLLVLRS